MNGLYIESGFTSVNKYTEELCGDRVETIYHEDTLTVVLADGLGSGVKANILSTLTSKIIGTMMASGMPIDECVATIAQTLPVCSQRQVAYSTFTILQVNKNGDTYIAQFDNPAVIYLHEGKITEYETTEKEICGKKIKETHMRSSVGDIFVLMSDGAIHAGIGMTLNYGWQLENIAAFAEEKYAPDLSAKMMSALICGACNELYMDKPGDDTTIAALKIREKQPVNLIIGPPVNPEDDQKVMDLFFGSEGQKIVCGGTTSSIVSRYLDRPVNTNLDYIDPTLPPTGSIEGVDLVTEGVLTLGRVLEIARQYGSTDFYTSWRNKKDGASLICKYLFEDATEVHFFVGRAKNPAHQNPALPLDLSLKLKLIEDLAENLRKMGKRVTMDFF